MQQSETINQDNVQTQIKQEIPLFSEEILRVKNFPIVNSLLNSWLVALIMIVIALAIRKKIRLVPRGIQNYLEIIFEKTIDLADSVTGSRQKSLKFVPIILPLFLFILFNNWLGILPGVGSVGFLKAEGAHTVFIPFLRSGMADLNSTLALAIIAVVLTHIFGAVMVGGKRHLNRFLNLSLFLQIPKLVFKEKKFTAILVNPSKFFVGLIETVGEFSKVASLSFRLFGNVFAGEILLGIMASIFAYFLPIPFLFMEILVGFIQALIFAMLILVFLSVMTTPHAEEH